MGVTVYFKDGGSKHFSDAVGYSVFKGKLYLWKRGKRKGKTPRATYNLSKLKKPGGWKVA